MKNVRRQFITDVVEFYIKNYPEEYKDFLRYIAERRAMLNDKNFGGLKGTTEMRVGVSVPTKCYNSFQYVLKGEEKPFGEPKGEMKWFTKKFPQFVLPNTY